MSIFCLTYFYYIKKLLFLIEKEEFSKYLVNQIAGLLFSKIDFIGKNVTKQF